MNSVNKGTKRNKLGLITSLCDAAPDITGACSTHGRDEKYVKEEHSEDLGVNEKTMFK